MVTRRCHLPELLWTSLLVAICVMAPTSASAAAGMNAGDWDSDHLIAPGGATHQCTSDRFAGTQLASGDLDGDGLEDVATGCAIADVGGTVDAGTAVVWLRSGETGGFRPGVRVPLGAPETGARCGTSLVIAQRAGGAELLVGCPGATVGGNAGAGAVRRVTVDASGVVTANGVLVSSAPATDLGCGFRIERARIDADGQHDLAVSCVQEEQRDGFGVVVVPRSQGSGLVFMRHVGDDGFDRTRLAPVGLQEANAGCGTALEVVERPVGPNGRHADVLLGCPWDSVTDAGSVFHWNVGSIVVFRRDTANTGFDPGLRIAETATTNPGSNCGIALTAFDVTSADYGIAAGCQFATVGGNWGAGAVVAFTPNGADWDDHPRLEVASADTVDGGCGFSLEAADLDGDSLDDLLVGCPSSHNGTPDWGKGVIGRFHGTGGPASPFVEAGAVTPTTVANPMVCGASVAAADVTGDGRADVVSGCAGAGTPSTYAHGALLVVPGIAGGTGLMPGGLQLPGPAPVAVSRCGADIDVLDGVGTLPPLVVSSCNDGLLAASAVTREMLPERGTESFVVTTPGTASGVRSVRLANTGTGIVHTGVPVLAGDTAVFSIVGSTCTNVTLAPRATCNVDLAFQPGTRGTFHARLQVPTSAGAPIEVSLAGTTPAAAEVEVAVVPPPRVPSASGKFRVTGGLYVSASTARGLGLRRAGRQVRVGSVRANTPYLRSGSLVDVRVDAKVRNALRGARARRNIPALLVLRVTTRDGSVRVVRRHVHLKRTQR